MSKPVSNALFVIIILFSGAFIFGCVHDQNIDRGEQYASAGDWDKSVRVLQEAYRNNPDDKETKLLLYRARVKASQMHMLKGDTLLEKQRYEEAIQEYQMAIAFNPANMTAESAIENAKALKESAYNFKKGKSLLRAGKYVQAKEALQESLRWNPKNTDAQQALDLYKEEKKRPPRFRLAIDTTTPVSLKFKSTPILNVFEVLTRLTGANFIFDKDVQETKVTLFVTDITFGEFLNILLKANKLAAKVVNEKTMIIYPETPQKAKEYEDLQIRTFYLANLDVKKAVAMLAKILNSKHIIANEKMNAVVIRGTREVIEIASRVIEANDRPVPEVMLHVEILEVGRVKEKQLGLEIDPASVTFGLSRSASEVVDDPENPLDFTQNVTWKALGNISTANLLLSIPTATLNLLKQDGDTQTLANPQIRTKNSEKANIHIGERVPLRVNRRVDTTGAVTTDFEYQDVGVKLDVEPTINIHDDISLKLVLEVSSLGDNVGTIEDPQYSIKTRTARSVLSMRTGETVIMGGLISDEERRTVRTIPLLGDIPAVGSLFKSYGTQAVKTDILMAITPIIVRGSEIPSAEVAEMWSGSETHFSLDEPFESTYDREKGYLDRPIKAFPLKKEGDGSEPLFEEKPPLNGSEPENLPKGPLPESSGPLPQTGTSRKAETTGSPGPPPEDVGRPRSDTQNKGREDPASPNEPPKKQAHRTVDRSWPPSKPYTIHVNSFFRVKAAEDRVQQLKADGFDCFFLPGTVQSKTYFRVFVGKFEGFQSAKETCEHLKKQSGFRNDIHVADRKWALGV